MYLSSLCGADQIESPDAGYNVNQNGKYQTGRNGFAGHDPVVQRSIRNKAHVVIYAVHENRDQYISCPQKYSYKQESCKDRSDALYDSHRNACSVYNVSDVHKTEYQGCKEYYNKYSFFAPDVSHSDGDSNSSEYCLLEKSCGDCHGKSQHGRFKIEAVVHYIQDV